MESGVSKPLRLRGARGSMQLNSKPNAAAGVSVQMRVSVPGAFHEVRTGAGTVRTASRTTRLTGPSCFPEQDIGFGSSSRMPNLDQALETAKKSAVVRGGRVWRLFALLPLRGRSSSSLLLRSPSVDRRSQAVPAPLRRVPGELHCK